MRTRGSTIPGYPPLPPLPPSSSSTAYTLPIATMGPEDFLAGPYHGDINPTTEEGAKKFAKATAHLPAGEKRQDATQENSTFFMAQVKGDAKTFGWGPLIHEIPVVGGQKMSILKDVRKLTLAQVQNSAYKTFGRKQALITDPLPRTFTVEDIEPWNYDRDKIIYFRRIRSKIIAMRLQNVISRTSWGSLLASKSSFTWTDSSGEEQYDGPTMLFILVSKVRPSTKIDVQLYKSRIRSAHAAKFGNNIQRLVDHVRTNYDAIVDIGGEYNDLIGDLFTILSTAKTLHFVTSFHAKELNGIEQKMTQLMWNLLFATLSFNITTW